jgi:prepilin-type N-terminal cleavage/methylation domain-containing protein
MHIIPPKNVAGFTLLEVLVSLFIFSLVMMATAQIFASAYSGYRVTRLVQHDIENAQFALNALAKALRNSSIVSAAGNQQSIKFFDHSQGKCFSYRIAGNVLELASGASTGVAHCNGMALAGFMAVTTGTVTGSFQVIPSAAAGGPATTVGRVTIALTVAENSASHSGAHLQTSVSLRDFGNIGLL